MTTPALALAALGPASALAVSSLSPSAVVLIIICVMSGPNREPTMSEGTRLEGVWRDPRRPARVDEDDVRALSRRDARPVQTEDARRACRHALEHRRQCEDPGLDELGEEHREGSLEQAGLPHREVQQN